MDIEAVGAIEVLLLNLSFTPTSSASGQAPPSSAREGGQVGRLAAPRDSARSRRLSGVPPVALAALCPARGGLWGGSRCGTPGDLWPELRRAGRAALWP